MDSIGLWLLDSSRKMLYLMTPQELALGEGNDYPQFLLLSGIPLFFLLIAIEFMVSKSYRPVPYCVYRFNDLISCVTVGAFQQISVVVFELLGLTLDLAAYTYVYNNFSLWKIDPQKYVYTTYVVLFLGKDIGYYAYHRFLHEFHVGWSGHSVHHSGEIYNLGTALRQGALQPLFSAPFYLWLAILGFPPQAFSAHSQLNTLYMFWIHTELIDRLPFGLEYILNRPMAHRMHHRTSTCNCNYAGVLIIWDRLFGTYRAETKRKEEYGLARPPKSFDAWELNTHHLRHLLSGQSGNNNNKKRSWVEFLMLRRVRSLYTVQWSRLIEPIPSSSWKMTRIQEKDLKGVLRPTSVHGATERGGTERLQWDGEAQMSGFTKVLMSLVVVISLIGMVMLLMRWKDVHRLDAGIGCMVCLVLLSSIGRVCDQRHAWGKTAVQSVLLLPFLFVFLLLQPWRRYISERPFHL